MPQMSTRPSKIPERLYTVCPLRILARSPSTDKDRYPLENNGNLKGTTEFIRLGDFTTQHVRVPSGSGLRILTDDVYVLKNEAGLSHNGFPFLPLLLSMQLGR